LVELGHQLRASNDASSFQMILASALAISSGMGAE
jgi:hypothetical protein